MKESIGKNLMMDSIENDLEENDKWKDQQQELIT